MSIRTKLHEKPGPLDGIILSCFVILITLHPYFLYGEINLFEMGFYLPGINALFSGLVPYRDFFLLRGPLELYVPAALMSVFGKHIGVMSAYFYSGTVLSLILCVLIARELFKTRLVLYLFTLVVVARTFPRSVFTCWGGMRYALGLLALLCAIRSFKNGKPVWLFGAGIAASLGLLTSIEIGACSVAGISAAFFLSLCLRLQPGKDIFKSAFYFWAGIFLIMGSYFIYLTVSGSFAAYLDVTNTVLTKLLNILGDESAIYSHPKNLWEGMLAMSPFNKSFDSLTPAYFYILLVGYLIFRGTKRRWGTLELMVTCIAVYGMVMFVAAFRKIGGAQFEMALQPEKVLFFLVLEGVYLRAIDIKRGVAGLPFLARLPAREKAVSFAVNFLIVGFILSSIGFSITKYDRRFFAYKFVKGTLWGKDTGELVPLSKEESTVLAIPRARGMVVPSGQAEDFEKLTGFIEQNTGADEAVFMFPELGAYHFIVDRPFVGRFPVATMAWIKDAWYAQMLKDLKAVRPRIAVVAKDPGPSFEEVYFTVPANRERYAGVMRFIQENYVPAAETNTLQIYRLREQ